MDSSYSVENLKYKAIKWTKIIFIPLLFLAMLGSLAYWGYQLDYIETNKDNWKDTVQLGKATLKQDAAFQAIVISIVLIHFVDKYL